MNKSLDAVLREKDTDPEFRREYMSPENQAYLIDLILGHASSSTEHRRTRPTPGTLRKPAPART